MLTNIHYTKDKCKANVNELLLELLRFLTNRA